MAMCSGHFYKVAVLHLGLTAFSRLVQGFPKRDCEMVYRNNYLHIRHNCS